MADLDDLGFTSITEMSNDEALELLRQIRLSRRTPINPTKTMTARKAKATPSVDAEQAAELIRLLMGDKK